MSVFTPDIACQELVELVTAYLDGDLSRRDRRRFRAHIAACDHCNAYLEQIRMVIQAGGHLRAEDLEPAVRDELLEAFRGWKGQRPA